MVKCCKCRTRILEEEAYEVEEDNGSDPKQIQYYCEECFDARFLMFLDKEKRK